MKYSILVFMSSVFLQCGGKIVICSGELDFFNNDKASHFATFYTLSSYKNFKRVFLHDRKTKNKVLRRKEERINEHTLVHFYTL